MGILQARKLQWVAMAAHNDQVNPAFLIVSFIPAGDGDLELSTYTSAERELPWSLTMTHDKHENTESPRSAGPGGRVSQPVKVRAGT